MFQQLPTAGLPFQFATWAEFESYADDLLTTGVIDELDEIRWDLRPAPKLGTLENRVCDGVSTFEDLAALIALMHCLVVDLDARCAAGETLPTMPPWHVQENKWRAARYGLDAIVILDAASTERLVTDDLADAGRRRLEPVAERLGCSAELASVARHPAPRRVVPAPARGRRRHRRRPGRGRRLGGRASCRDQPRLSSRPRARPSRAGRRAAGPAGRARPGPAARPRPSASVSGSLVGSRQRQAAGDRDERPVAQLQPDPGRRPALACRCPRPPGGSAPGPPRRSGPSPRGRSGTSSPGRAPAAPTARR